MAGVLQAVTGPVSTLGSAGGFLLAAAGGDVSGAVIAGVFTLANTALTLYFTRGRRRDDRRERDEA